MADKKKILIVDDDQSIIDSVALLLKNDYEIATANNGKAGLELLHTSRPDLIILDLLMPEKDGFDVCRKIKEDPAYKDIPVITLSSFTELYDMRFGSEDTKHLLPTDTYLTKPLDPATLLKEVQDLIGD